MDLRTRARRLVYLAHRWTGIAGCLLMLLWFLSGIVMLYIGYPKLTPWERLAPLPALDADACCAPLAALPPRAREGALALTSIGGEPYYVVREGARWRAYPASAAPAAAPENAISPYTAGRKAFPREPTPQKSASLSATPQEAATLEASPLDTALLKPAAITVERALAAARDYAPGQRLRYAGQVDEDRWTHSHALDAHRPLLRVQAQGRAPATLYVSSATGAVVLDAPLAQQRWNYVGAWLHWLYMFRDRSVDPAWSWIVIALSALGTLAAVSGVLVGVWRWRFTKRYKSGRRTPYREAWMRWHHVAGLLFSAFVFSWIFSGLMSMNPAEMFSSPDAAPRLAAYQKGPAAASIADAAAADAAPADPRPVLRALHRAGFDAVELQWRRLDGRGYVLAYDAHADSRLVLRQAAGLAVKRRWAAIDILPAARRLFPGAQADARKIDSYDAYYYQRHPEAMNGAAQHGLPALRVDFGNPARSRAYIDLRTGEVALCLARRQRLGRWLFNFLHSWDTPALLDTGPARDLVLILLSVGGLAVSATGVVVGWRRLRGKLAGPRRATG